MIFRTLPVIVCLVAGALFGRADASTLTAFSGTVQLPAGTHETFKVLLYRGNSSTDPDFNGHRQIVATTDADSSGKFIFFVPDLGLDADVTIRAKSSALHLGGDAVIQKPDTGPWPETTSDIQIALVPQSDPNFGIQNQRYARRTMAFVTDRLPEGRDFANTAAPSEELRTGTFTAHVALANGQAIPAHVDRVTHATVPDECGLAKGWKCDGQPMTNDDAFVDTVVTTARGNAVGPTLAQLIANAPDGRVLLFVHGYNNSFLQGAGIAARLSYLMEPAAHSTILYSWPSAAQLVGYPQDQKNAELSAANLVKVLDLLAAGTKPPDVILAAHSMGSYALMSALYIWSLKNPTRHDVFSDLVMFAGDVDVALWDTRRDDIFRVVRHVHVYANTNDQALHMSTCATGDNRPRIGQVTAWSQPVIGFDATALASTDGFGHGYLVGSTTVGWDWNRFTNALPPGNPPDALRKTPWLHDGGGGWFNSGKLTADAVCRLFRNLHV